MRHRSRAAALLVLGLFLAVVLGMVPGPAPVPAAAAAPQRGVTSLTAPVIQPGGRPVRSTKARLSGTVKFSPARRGRPVMIQRRVDDGPWRRIARKRQNGSGAVRFTSAAQTANGSPYTFRGVAVRWRGRPRIAATGQRSDVWERRFVDEFSRRSLGARWADRGSRAESRTCAKVGDRRASQVRNGTLRLQVKLDPAKRGRTCRVKGVGRFRYYLNGQVSTQHVPTAFTRGTFAARIKFARQRGQHGGFWLQPVRPRSLAGRPARSGAEIDIVEFFGQGYPGGGLASFLYNYGIKAGKKKIGGVSPRATRMLPRGDAWWKRYHVFSLEWTRNAYIFRVDGREHYRTRRGVSGVDEYLILSMLTSDWELAQAKRRGIRPRGTMRVDWARVWQK